MGAFNITYLEILLVPPNLDGFAWVAGQSKGVKLGSKKGFIHGHKVRNNNLPVLRDWLLLQPSCEGWQSH